MTSPKWRWKEDYDLVPYWLRSWYHRLRREVLHAGSHVLPLYKGHWGYWACPVYCPLCLSCISLGRCLSSEQYPARQVLGTCLTTHLIWDQEGFLFTRFTMTKVGRKGMRGMFLSLFTGIIWTFYWFLKKPHRGQGIWFLLSSCPDALEFSGYQPCTWLLSGLWCETISVGAKSEGGGGSVVCPHVVCLWVQVPAQGAAWGGRQLWR